jgi:hypothetical protein
MPSVLPVSLSFWDTPRMLRFIITRLLLLLMLLFTVVMRC